MVLQSRSSTQGLGWTSHFSSARRRQNRTVITAAKVYKRRIIKDYQITTRYATTRTKIFL
jgi:hypothetical protein